MKALRGSRSRFISGLAVTGGLALLALQPLAAAHAFGTPLIRATVEPGRAVIQVAGSGFGPGDRVEVVDRAAGAVIGRVFTTASQIIIKPPKCTSSNPCYYFTLAGGIINVTLPPHYVKCAYQMVAVRAFDLTNHTVSNVVYARLGPGPC
ncbi:MAG TPA: hypothetical protein VN837_06890 [Chloroflexota bacterium]|nr:hypothetical protein [Chloroflexota bacterium]